MKLFRLWRHVLGLRSLLPVALSIAVIVACGKFDASKFALPTACTVAPRSLDFGAVRVDSFADRTFTVTNGGSEALAGTVSEPCGDYALLDSLGFSIAPGAARSFTVRFSPGSAGPHPCTVSIAGCSELAVTGQGVTATPSCNVSPTVLDFGTVTSGASSDTTFTIINTGNTRLSGTVSESCPEFSLAGTGVYDLAPTEQATFTVRFSPAGEGSKSCTIHTGLPCADVSASGTGQAPSPGPECQVSTTALTFGTVAIGQSATRTFTMKNVGGDTLSGTVSQNCSEFSIVDPASYALRAGQSATMTVRFTPLAAGDSSCTISTGSTCASVSATGTGQAPAPVCQLSATSIDFADVSLGQTADRSLTVTNTGGSTLSGALTASCSEFAIVGAASYSLGPLESATFTLRFEPTALGDSACTLDVGASCGTVGLHGRGAPPPECQLSALTHDFGQVQVDRHKDFTFAIRNVGGGQLCGTATEDCEMFSFLSGPSYCVVPGTPFNLKVRFLPRQTGPFQCVIDPGAGCPSITVTGTGVP
jgi:hypothetical protein